MEDKLSDAEKQRYEEIVKIQNYLLQGYSPTQICNLMHTTYKRVRKYATGDPEKLCQYARNTASKFDKYQDAIIGLIKQHLQLKDILAYIQTLGCTGKSTAFYDYCNKLIKEHSITYTPRKNSLGVPIEKNKKIEVHYLKKQDVIKHLWSGKELAESDIKYLFDKYPCLNEIKKSIEDFRKIYDEKNTVMLDKFIETYSKSTNKNLASFSKGLMQDKNAVTNSVISKLSNGFVEGINNKVKAIKRIMYGKAKIKLLSAKVIFG